MSLLVTIVTLTYAYKRYLVMVEYGDSTQQRVVEQLTHNEAEAINLAQNGINMYLMVGAFETQQDESRIYKYLDPAEYFDISVGRATWNFNEVE